MSEKTIKNLGVAFVTENLARNRYQIYSKVASKEGYEEIADIFMETARNEFFHAKVLFKLLMELCPDQEALEVPATIPIKYSTTEENLKTAIAGEHEEGEVIYPEFADIAEEEGLPLVAAKLRNIGLVEDHHEARYKALLNLLEEDKFFNRDEEVTWVCKKCGFVYKGEKPPEKCPICEHPQAFFERQEDLY